MGIALHSLHLHLYELEMSHHLSCSVFHKTWPIHRSMDHLGSLFDLRSLNDWISLATTVHPLSQVETNSRGYKRKYFQLCTTIQYFLNNDRWDIFVSLTKSFHFGHKSSRMIMTADLCKLVNIITRCVHIKKSLWTQTIFLQLNHIAQKSACSMHVHTWQIPDTRYSICHILPIKTHRAQMKL